MTPITAVAQGESQASKVAATDDVEQAVISLVGDLAAYRPKAKVVIFEGGGDSDVDVRIVSRLFPTAAQRLNLVSGGHKRRVRDLYGVLSEAATQAGLSERFYAVIDRDRGDTPLPDTTNIMRWDRYHIENYLLHEPSIYAALATILDRVPFVDEEEVTAALKECAKSLIHRLVLERLQDEINRGLIQAIEVRASPATTQPSIDLKPSIAGSIKRLRERGGQYESSEWLNEAEAKHRAVLTSALESDAWRAEFPGRSILAAFVNQFVPGASYDVFRNVVVEKMVEGGVQPDGLKKVLDSIDAL
jgi:hypothetical protein